MIPDGKILLDSEIGKRFDFTSDRFDVCSYLWRKDDRIYIPIIISLNRGNFKNLIAKITEAGFDAVVPNPLPNMESVCKHIGMRKGFEYDPICGPFVVYYLSAKKAPD